MADIYGVTPADIAAELPGVFPGGFSATTIPTEDQVRSYISVADLTAALRVTDDVGQAPNINDKAAALVKRYIIESVKAFVLRIVYTGNDAVQVDAAVRPFEISAKSMLDSIDALGAQAIGTGEAAPRVIVPYTTPQRDLVLNDEDLDFRAQRGRY